MGLDDLMKSYHSDNWTSCASPLEKTDCVKSLEFEAPASTGSLYGPTNTPARGTQTLFNNPGAVSSPVSGATYSWTAGGVYGTWVVTLTALEADVKYVAPTSTSFSGGNTTAPTQTGSGSSATGGSATSSGTDAAQTLKPSAGVRTSTLNVATFVAALLAAALISYL